MTAGYLASFQTFRGEPVFGLEAGVPPAGRDRLGPLVDVRREATTRPRQDLPFA